VELTPASRRLRAALAAVLVPGAAPEVALAHRWLDNWRGVGQTTEKVYAKFTPDYVVGSTATLEGVGTQKPTQINARSNSPAPKAVRTAGDWGSLRPPNLHLDVRRPDHLGLALGHSRTSDPRAQALAALEPRRMRQHFPLELAFGEPIAYLNLHRQQGDCSTLAAVWLHRRLRASSLHSIHRISAGHSGFGRHARTSSSAVAFCPDLIFFERRLV
jgi:hypothetical protein